MDTHGIPHLLVVHVHGCVHGDIVDRVQCCQRNGLQELACLRRGRVQPGWQQHLAEQHPNSCLSADQHRSCRNAGLEAIQIKQPAHEATGGLKCVAASKEHLDAAALWIASKRLFSCGLHRMNLCWHARVAITAYLWSKTQVRGDRSCYLISVALSSS